MTRYRKAPKIRQAAISQRYAELGMERNNPTVVPGDDGSVDFAQRHATAIFRETAAARKEKIQAFIAARAAGLPPPPEDGTPLRRAPSSHFRKGWSPWDTESRPPNPFRRRGTF